MNARIKPPESGVGRFDPDCAEQSWTLPARFYFEPKIFAAEIETIFDRSWNYQCHHSEIGKNIYHGRVGQKPIWLQRDDNQSLQAYDAGRRRPIAVETYAGFVFANLDADAAPLREQAGRLLDDIYACCPRVDELVPVERLEREVAANWKTVVDNNHECYHCAANHKTLMQLVDYEKRAVWSDDGITFSHSVERKRLDNQAYRLDADRVEQDSLFAYIWPTLVPLWFPGTPSAVLFQIIPVAPERSLIRHDFYFLDQELSRQERDFVQYIDQVLVPEDLSLCESVQRGLHSRGYQQGKFIVNRKRPEYSEHHVHFFQRLVYQALAGATA